jgi:tRNA(Ile)-lysidine synthase
MLAAAGIGWVNDPSNADKAALRPRLRLLRGDRDGVGAATAALVDSAAAANRQRIRAAAATAAWLAARVTLRPEGFALLPDEAMPPAALAGLIQTIGGAAYPPPTESVASLAQAPRAATLAGVRLLPAGRMGPGWLMLREAAAMAPPVPARAGALWDGRFRLTASAQLPPDATLGAVGADSARLRRLSTLPAAVLCALPALRQGDALLAVPHLGYPSDAACADANVVFSPPRPAAGAATFANGDA